MTGSRVRADRKTSLKIKTGSRRRLVRLSPLLLSGIADEARAAVGRARRERMFPTDAVTYDQLAEPAAVVSQKVFQSRPMPHSFRTTG